MLRYSVRPSKDTELRDFPIRELFVSPDLLYISGTTDVNVGLVDGEQVVIKSPYLIGNEITTINAQTVKRQAKVEISIDLPVKTIVSPLNFRVHHMNSGEAYILADNKKVPVTSDDDYIISSVTQSYVEYKGDICYFFKGSPTGYLIDHKFYSSPENRGGFITIKTYTYIEDGKLQIGDYTYYADFSKEGEKPTLRLSKEHEPLVEGSNDVIGLIDGCECRLVSIKDYKPIKWERVTKFNIQKENNPEFNVSDVLYGGYRHYVTFADENYYIRDVYQYDKEQDADVYMGYGILLNDTFYSASTVYNDFLFDKYHDLPMAGSMIYVGEYDTSLEIFDSLISLTSGGCFVMLIGADDEADIVPGNFIIAQTNYPIELRRTVMVDEDLGLTAERGYGNEYVEFESRKYLIENKLYNTINVSGDEYLLTYLNDNYTSASTVINGETMYFDVTGTTAKLSNKIYYKDPNDSSKVNVKYGINENVYTITEGSGVTINGETFQVIDEKDAGDEIENPQKYVLITKTLNLTLEVREKNGLNTYVAYPVIDNDTIDEFTENEMQRVYCEILVNNWKAFNFSVRKDTFGKHPLTVKNGLMDATKSELPYAISDAYLLENKIEILRMQNYLSFKLPLTYKTANNLRREEIIKNDFVDYVKGEAINTVVDMEKDVYYPVWKNEDNEFKPIQQIRFNMHFRTRDFDNWKRFEDDREFKDVSTPNYIKSNWFITDLNYYKGGNFERKRLQNASDLLGLMNFTTDEIKYQATKIGKSFLRLSFYSTNNPKTQVLLATSTIFLDENLAYKKYINSKRNADLIFADVRVMQEAGYSTLDKYIDDVNRGADKYQVSSNTITNASEVYNDKFLNDDTRLSSRLVVNDKYNSDTSSEGYYIYMFKDYAKKMRESTIYMKVDFNHAGIGQTMSFMLPRKKVNGDVDGIGEPLYIHKDLETLKNGFKLTDIYMQTHIPIRVIYDDKTNRYVYYLPEELRENKELNVDNEIMEFNLFEIKFANESIVENES